MSDEHLTLADVAKRLGHQHGAVYNQVVAGQLVATGEQAGVPVFSLAAARRLLGEIIADHNAARRMRLPLTQLRGILIARHVEIIRCDQDGTKWFDSRDVHELRTGATAGR
jgi:hypothetical protein